MYEYHNNLLSIPANLLYSDLDLIAYNTYKVWCHRGKLVRTKAGKGKGNTAWISYYDIAEEWVKNAVKAKYGDPKDVIVENQLENYITPDHNAIKFFAAHRKPDGSTLSFKKQQEKATNAAILNAIETVFKQRGLLTKMFGKKKIKVWENISDAVNHLASKTNGDNKRKWNFKLPGNPRSLKRRYDDYLEFRYDILIHKGEGSNNARKVTRNIENLIISLYCLPNKPYASTTHDLYLQFLGGAIEVVNITTGELFDRADFYENDQPIEISEGTVWNYLRMPKNDLIIKKFRNGYHDFSHKERPYIHRRKPNYAMSKISLDDRDIMHTKTKQGEKVMAYYAFDVMSGAMIGIAHSRSKDAELYLDCIRNMFRFTNAYGVGVPMEMEVENHLVKEFSDGLMKIGNVFPFVRWCNPQNSQEKYAENRIKAKKYGVEKMNNQNVGRHYSRLDSNRVIRQKIFDEKNNTYVQATASYKQIVANELEEQKQYNNQLHPNQKKYQGMTRLNVFLHHINPDLPDFNKSHLAKYIGEKTETSIVRNQFVTVQYGKYQLPSTEMISLLKPNNYEVDAYYIPTLENEVKEVFIYQNEKFICQCDPVPTNNTAKSEWTDADKIGFEKGKEYTSEFDKMIYETTKEKLQRVSIIKNTNTIIDVATEIVEELPTVEEFEYKALDEVTERNRAINDL